MIRESLLAILPDLKSIEEAPLKNEVGEIVGWHANVLVESGKILGSGTHQDCRLARTIALSEAMERRIAHDLRHSSERENFLLDKYPTTCGFAVGMDEEATQKRALAEAVERWLRSKWIDEHFSIPKVQEKNVIPQLSALGLEMRAAFEEVIFLQIMTPMTAENKRQFFYSAIVVGLKGNGAFVGSRTSLNTNDLWTHALIEAWRHLILFERSSDRESLEMKPIIYFGENQGEALRQIALAEEKQWIEPELLLFKKVNIGQPNLFCYRALCKDFKGWHGGDYRRFVY